jgi:hypothetical protein
MGGVEQMLLILIMTAATLSVAYFMQRTSRDHVTRNQGSHIELLWEIVLRYWVPIRFLALFAFLVVYEPTTTEAWLPTMVALALLLIRFGLNEDRGRPFAVGVGYLLFWAVLRYVDLFGAFGGLRGASLMFFLCGAAMLGVALHWRKRKVVPLV